MHLKFGRNEVDFNRYANSFWHHSGLKNLRSNVSSNSYRLTEKQKMFIKTGLETFEELYLKYLEFYETKKPTVCGEIRNIFENYLTKTRIIGLLKEPSREASSFFGGFLAAYIFYKHDDKRNEETNQWDDILKTMKPCIDFFGFSSEIAMNFYEPFLIEMSIRFQAAIELLEYHQEGINNFVQFIVYSGFQKISDFSRVFSKYGSSDLNAKIDVLMNKILGQSFDDKFYQAWSRQKLKTIDNRTEWSICGLLSTSPIETKVGILIYSGEDPDDQSLLYPAQICSNEENNGTYKMMRF